MTELRFRRNAALPFCVLEQISGDDKKTHIEQQERKDKSKIIMR